MEYDSHGPDITTTYRMITEDGIGLKLHTPFLGVSINDSPFVPVSDLIVKALEVSDMTLKSYQERTAS